MRLTIGFRRQKKVVLSSASYYIVVAVGILFFFLLIALWWHTYELLEILQMLLKAKAIVSTLSFPHSFIRSHSDSLINNSASDIYALRADVTQLLLPLQLLPVTVLICC